MPGTVEAFFQALFAGSDDVIIQSLPLGNKQCTFVYCEGSCSERDIFTKVIPLLTKSATKLPSLDNPDKDTIMRSVYGGSLLICFGNESNLYVQKINQTPHRNPEQSNLEISIRGPKDAFVENIESNTALIRKRISSNTLHFESLRFGAKTQTKAGIMYLADVINNEILERIKEKLNKIETDSLISSTHLKEWLQRGSWTIFPLISMTSRPDFAAECLLQGRVIMLLDGNPTVLITPINFTFLLKTAEDLHTSFYFVSFERLIRTFAIFVSMFLPGLWIALVSYHQDQLPFSLLATLSINRQGIPLPTPLEMFVMLSLFELFREAGVRLPTAVGQTLGVVGGLIVGDAAIRAGLTSPSMVVIAAITAISSFTVISSMLAGSATLVRFFVFLMSALFGLLGFFLALFAVCFHLSSLKSFGVPYMAPMSMNTWRDIVKSYIRFPEYALKHRPHFLKSEKERRDKQ